MVPTLNTGLFWMLFIVFTVVAFFSQALPFSKVSRPLKIFGNYWMGVFIYSLLTILAIDTIRIILKVTQIQPEFLSTKNGEFAVGIFIILVVAGFFVGGLWRAKKVKTVSYDITINKPSKLSGFKIALVSDLHLGNMIGYDQMKLMVEKINALKPDMVVLAGDVFDGSYDAVDNPKGIAELYKTIKTTYGTYAVLGNHDAGRTYSKMESFFQEAGVKLLLDESVVIEEQLTVIGRKDRRPIGEQGPKRKAIEELIPEVDFTKPVIVLDHQPNGIQDARQIKADLLLCGHTHRGQITPGNFITKKVFEIDYGHLKTGDLNTIVSSGYGTWGPPMRLASHSEVVEINVHFKAE